MRRQIDRVDQEEITSGDEVGVLGRFVVNLGEAEHAYLGRLAQIEADRAGAPNPSRRAAAPTRPR